MQLLLISQLVIRQKHNRVPIYCANRENTDTIVEIYFCWSDTVNFSDRSPEHFIFYESHHVSLLVTISVKQEEFFNTASGLFVITTCFYYDCQQLSTYKSSNMDIPQVWNQFPIRNFLQNQPVHHPKGNYNHDKD